MPFNTLDIDRLRQSGTPRYRANPLEYLLVSLVTVPPFPHMPELNQILSKILIFLQDEDLPSEYSKAFFDGLKHIILSSTNRRTRLNAWFAVDLLDDNFKQA